MRARSRLVVDMGLIAGAVLAFASGLVLLLAFHIGHGCFRPEALGLSRLVWQNLHRLGAVLGLAGMFVHTTINRKSIYVRALRVLRGKVLRHDTHEIFVYLGNTIIVLTGFVAWLVVGGSMPVLGPAWLGPVTPARHAWIDAHNYVGMVTLVLTINHVRRRWHALATILGRARADKHARSPTSGREAAAHAREQTSRWPWTRAHVTGFIAVDSRRCQACWDCVQACPQGALGKVSVLWHRHVRIQHASACTGCGRCLRVCKQGALFAVSPSASHTGRRGSVASPRVLRDDAEGP